MVCIFLLAMYHKHFPIKILKPHFNKIAYIRVLRQWHPAPVLLVGKSHGRRSLVGCSPWGRTESDTTEGLHFSLFMHCRRKWQPTPVFLPGEFQGRGSLVTAIYGVAQSQTRLKQLSSSSSRAPL